MKQSSSDRDRIEEAETHGLVSFGVMSGRSYDGETVLNVTHGGFKGQIDDTTDSHSGGRRGIQFVPRGVGIDAYSAAGQPHETLDRKLRELRHVQLLSVHWIRSCARQHVLLYLRLRYGRRRHSAAERKVKGGCGRIGNEGGALTKEKSVSFAVTRLNLLEGGFARTYSIAAL